MSYNILKLDPSIFVEAAEGIFLHPADLNSFGKYGCCHALDSVQRFRGLAMPSESYGSQYHIFFAEQYPWSFYDELPDVQQTERVDFGPVCNYDYEARAHRVQALLLCAAIVEHEQAAARRKNRRARK